MGELTVLDEKLAEVLGLAQAARQATKRVATLARREDEHKLVKLLDKMSDDAREVEKRCQAVASTRDGLRTAIATEARETKSDVLDFMRTYLEGAETLDGFEFLSMAEAGELAHWRILAVLNETAKHEGIAEAIAFALPLQEKHVSSVSEASLGLAAGEDPAEDA
jgi:hypothetical protein